ncbi:hypothetical protein [Empedobacter tilapiae]|uniref:Uncharacterized protein n=1 Tax=Empedobacter tilapiae TaxID=2491114 RepID=A0A4Z1BFZ8_9FLAO|nr:hypothetical protein [Empedobacter tilapiae]TGN26657.1 hypothetical protein E4J94_09410 [Empedobacter tilapiae]
MNNNSNQQDNNNEIDLLHVSNSIKKGFNNSLKIIPLSIKFIKKNILILIGLFVIGAIGGFFYNKMNLQYRSNIIVTPNFDTVDYLNEKIAQLNANIQQKDTAFFNKIGIDKSMEISSVSIKPIPDLYKFLNEEDKYYDIFKTLSENSDAKKVSEDLSTSKYFSKHLITITSKKKTDKKVLDQIVKYINSSNFYEVYRVEILQNLKDKIVINDSTILQIDAILKKAGSPSTNTTISLNNDSQLTELVNEKLKLVKENHQLKVHQFNLKYIVTPVNYSENIEDHSGLKGKYHLIFPALLIGLFIIISLIRKFK